VEEIFADGDDLIMILRGDKHEWRNY
jgi:hypothetical protein